MPKKEINWEAPEFEYISKGVGWYWLTIIAAILLVGLALWQGNFLFAIFVVIAVFLVLTWGSHYPRTVEFKVDDNGLAIGEQKFYPYEDLKGFAVKSGHMDSELAEIVFIKKNRLSPQTKIFIDNSRLKEVKNFLGQHLPELEYEESLIEHIARLLRF